MNIFLGAENLSIGGKVEFRTCVNCKFDTFMLQLSADTDMVYQGIIGFASNARKELLITHLTTDEYHNFGIYDEYNIAERVNKIFNRDDFSYYRSKHFYHEDGEKYWSPVCPKCQSSLELKRTINFKEFISEGGKIMTYSVYDEVY